MMNRKDFELLAKAIKTLPVLPNSNARSQIAKHIASAIEGHYATFDKDRFIKACASNEETVIDV